uniref:Uncharacterized protein n=1 Tax=Anguilla anguilla TaxID=7936 RepID=A0A0E9PS15_ANGAN
MVLLPCSSRRQRLRPPADDAASLVGAVVALVADAHQGAKAVRRNHRSHTSRHIFHTIFRWRRRLVSDRKSNRDDVWP